MSKRKPILCLGFDGVLHSYTSGWKGASNIPDAPVPGAIEFILAAMQEFEVHIYSARSGQEGGISAMTQWLLEHGFPVEALDNHASAQELKTQALEQHPNPLRFPISKPPAMLTIDDRAVQFMGVFPEIQSLLSFKPWNYRNI